MKKYFPVLLIIIILFCSSCANNQKNGGAAKTAATATPAVAPSSTPDAAAAALDELNAFLEKGFDEFNAMVAAWVNEICYYKGCSASLGYYGPDILYTFDALNNQPYELATGLFGDKKEARALMVFTTPATKNDYESYYFFNIGLVDLKIYDIIIGSSTSAESAYETFKGFKRIGENTFKIPAGIPQKPEYEGLDENTWKGIEQAIKQRIDDNGQTPENADIWVLPAQEYTVYVLNANPYDRTYLAVTKDSQEIIYFFNGMMDAKATGFILVEAYSKADEAYVWFKFDEVAETFELIKTNAGHVFTHTKE